MKVFTYKFDLYFFGAWHSDIRSGVVVANTKEEALKLLRQNYLSNDISLVDISEVNLSEVAVEEISQDTWDSES